MESIKNQLLTNIEDPHDYFDHSNADDQTIILYSYAIGNGNKYEMNVQIKAFTSEREFAGSYHSDRGDTEGYGSYFEISDFNVESIHIFIGDDTANVEISTHEIYKQLIFKL